MTKTSPILISFEKKRKSSARLKEIFEVFSEKDVDKEIKL